MLLPRPEIKIATRRTSRIVRRGPVLGRVPRRGLAADGAAAPTVSDAADFEQGFPRSFEPRANLFHLFGIDNHRHADPAIECPPHFFRCDVATPMNQRDNRRQWLSAG